MARSRNIKPGFFKNEVLSSLDPHTRLLFAGLWTIADREGRFEVRLEKIKAELFPHEQVMLEACMTQLWDKQFLTFYEAGEKHFGQVNNWTKHQSPHHKEVASEIPACKQEKIFKDQEDIYAWLKHGSCMNQSRFNKNASCPTDSLNLIPDSLNSDSGQPADRFDDWWDAYPNKVKKKPCREIWKRRKLNTRADELIADVERRKAEDGRWLEGFIPDPTTYLNQDRWDDELTKRREKKQTEELWKLTDAELIERAQRKHISTSGKSRQQLIAALEAA